MQKLNFQDTAFLRLEAPQRPFHVAGLMRLTLPKNAPAGFTRELAQTLGDLPAAWPILRKQLNQPDSSKPQGWVDAEHYNPDYHIHHYALPPPGGMQDLLQIVSRVQERMLARDRPLWEFHLIEGLGRNSIALYFKIHHALIDGVTALRMVDELFSKSPGVKLDLETLAEHSAAHHHRRQKSLFTHVSDVAVGLMEQGRALPQLSSMLLSMGWRGLREGAAAPPLPYTSPHAMFNKEVTAQRCIITTELALKKVKAIGAACDGTINDALIAICGGAIRNYLVEHNALPAKSLRVGIPVAVEPTGDHEGNQLSTIVCSLCTDLDDPRARLERIVRITGQAKQDMSKLSNTALQGYMNLMVIPTMVLTLAGAATSIPPGYNLLISNVPGPRQRLYLNGAKLEAIYPLSIITDTVGLNITIVSYMSKICMGITACPSFLPGIESLGTHIKMAYAELADAVLT